MTTNNINAITILRLFKAYLFIISFYYLLAFPLIKYEKIFTLKLMISYIEISYIVSLNIF